MNDYVNQAIARRNWKPGQCYPDCRECFHYDADPCVQHRAPPRSAGDAALVLVIAVMMFLSLYFAGGSK